MRQLTLLIGVSAFSLGIGFFSGRQSTERISTSKSTTSDRNESARRPSGIGAPDRLLPSELPVESLLDRFHKDSSPLGRAKLDLAIAGLPPAKLQGLASQLGERAKLDPYNEDVTKLVTSVLTAWADTSPDAALAFAKESTSGNFHNIALQAVFGVWGRNRAGDVSAAIAGLVDETDRSSARYAAAEALADIDPRQAWQSFGDKLASPYQLDILGKLAGVSPKEAVEALQRRKWANSGDPFSQGPSPIFSRWASKDPEAVVSWATSCDDPSLRSVALQAAFGHLAVLDPSAALSRLDAVPQSSREPLFGTIMNTWAANDLQGVMQAARGFEQPQQREAAYQAIAYNIRSLEPSAAASVIQEMPDGQAKAGALSMFSDNLASLPPDEGMKILDTFQGEDRARLASNLAISLIGSNLDSAFSVFNSIPESERTSSTTRNFLSGVASEKPIEAIDYALTLSPSSDRTLLVETSFANMAGSTPAEAVSRFAQLTNPDERDKALIALGRNWNSDDAPGQDTWMQTLSQGDRGVALAGLAERKVNGDPPGAAASFSEAITATGAVPSPALTEAAAYIAQEWAPQYPEKASEWISSLPEGEIRDAAIPKLIESLSASDPAGAFSWALDISDPAKRSSNASDVLSQWNRIDPTAAAAAIQGADLSAADRAALEKYLH